MATRTSDGAVLLAGAAMVLGRKDGFTLCTGMVLDSLPPAGCGGPKLDFGALDPTRLPGYQTYTGNTTTTTSDVGIVGWWDGSVLHVAKVVDAAAVPPRPDRDPTGLETACADPGGSQVPRPSSGPSGPVAADEAVAAAAGQALAYADAQPDLSRVWYSEDMYVVNAAFAGNIDQHRAAMRALYSGPLCVVAAKYREADLRAVQDKLVSSAPGADGRPIAVSIASAGLDGVDLDVIYASDADIAAIRAATLPEVFVHNMLVPIPAGSPLAAGLG